jgi:large subunit ribosomal protein L23
MNELHIYDVIRRPVITEKSNIQNDDLNQYVFEVDLTANKIQIREAVEFVFEVDVKNVNTMVMPAKRARRGQKYYQRKKAWKKAIVTLEPGQSIKLFDV